MMGENFVTNEQTTDNKYVLVSSHVCCTAVMKLFERGLT